MPLPVRRSLPFGEGGSFVALATGEGASSTESFRAASVFWRTSRAGLIEQSVSYRPRGLFTGIVLLQLAVIGRRPKTEAGKVKTPSPRSDDVALQQVATISHS